MKLLNLFNRKSATSTAARQMRMAGVDKERALIRATTDEIRAEIGMEPAVWPEGGR